MEVHGMGDDGKNHADDSNAMLFISADTDQEQATSTLQFDH
jgi:hypothetical protein